MVEMKRRWFLVSKRKTVAVIQFLVAIYRLNHRMTLIATILARGYLLFSRGNNDTLLDALWLFLAKWAQHIYISNKK